MSPQPEVGGSGAMDRVEWPGAAEIGPAGAKSPSLAPPSAKQRAETTPRFPATKPRPPSLVRPFLGALLLLLTTILIVLIILWAEGYLRF